MKKNSIAKICQLSQFAIDKLTFSWKLGSDRKGVLSTSNVSVSNDSLLALINSLPKVSIFFKLNNEIIRQIPSLQLVILEIKNLSNLKMLKCEIDLGLSMDTLLEVMWEGELQYENSDFCEFKLFFIKPGKYNIKLMMDFENFPNKKEEISFNVI